MITFRLLEGNIMKVDQELTKLYYSIGEVSAMFDVSNSLIRYWETEFSKLKPQKNKKGDRRYTTKDIAIIEKIYTLVKERGFTLEGAKKELRKKNVPQDSVDLLLQLQKIKDGLLKLRKSLD